MTDLVNIELEQSMKVLQVYGDDYAAMEFEEQFAGQKVSDIIAKLESGELEEPDNCSYRIHEFSGSAASIDPEFIFFIQNNMMDYDGMKHENFYMENEVVGGSADEENDDDKD